MNTATLTTLPEWVSKDATYDLVLTNDIDSLVSCVILKMCKGWDVKYFYDFNTVYYSRQLKRDNAHPRVWVDCCVLKERGFDNHVTMLSSEDWINPNLCNLNNVYKISADDYFSKYNLSTALLVWSIYGLPIPKSEEGKMILLSIDSSYCGYFSRYENDNKQCKHWLVDILEMQDLYSCLERHKFTDFYRIKSNYKINKVLELGKHLSFTDLFGEMAYSSWMNKIGKELGLNISLPQDEFKKWMSFDNRKDHIRFTNKSDYGKIFSLAVTGRDFISYSVSA